MRRLMWLVLIGWISLASPAWADDAPAPLTEEQKVAEQQAAVQQAIDTGTKGPADITLLKEGKIHIQKGQIWAPTPTATRVMRAFGNSADPHLVGIIFDPNDSWVATMSFVADGYVSDEDSKQLDATAILQNIREGTDAANKDRQARGFKTLEIEDWIKPPNYDAATHRLTWALRTHLQDAETHFVNYNTRMLGREGYFALNMLTSVAAFAHDRDTADDLLSTLTFDTGKRFEDFNASTDKVAEYGLAALIGVVAAKKLGLLAAAGLLLVKFGKITAIATAAIGSVMVRIFKRKPKTPA